MSPRDESLLDAHTHATSPCTQRPCSTHTALPRTLTRLGAAPAGLGEDVWAQKLGCLYFPLASFLQLALQATGREPEPTPPTPPNTHTHTRGKLTAHPELTCKHQKLLRRVKSEQAELSQPHNHQRPRVWPAPLSLQPGLNQGKPSEVLADGGIRELGREGGSRL